MKVFSYLLLSINLVSAIIQPVSFTAHYKKDGTGLVSYEQMKEQVAVLNDAFNDPKKIFDVSFELASVRFIKDDDLFDLCTLPSIMRQYRPKYMTDPSRHLNIYVCWCENMLGLAYLPTEYRPENHYIYAPVVHWKLLAGNKNYTKLKDEFGSMSTLINSKMWSQGKTLIHEIGHHYGLKHPYEGACDGTEANSDNIADTPRIFDNPLKKCSSMRGLNSCPRHPGRDDLSNYMMMTDDPCKNHFTRGQYDYMHKAIKAFKPILAQGISLPTCVASITQRDNSPDLAPCINVPKKNKKGILVCRTDPNDAKIIAHACCPSGYSSWTLDTCRQGIPVF